MQWVGKEERKRIRETNGNFDSCNSYKRLVPGRLHELHESKFRLFHVSNLSVRNFRIFLLIYPGSVGARTAPVDGQDSHQPTVRPARHPPPPSPPPPPRRRSVSARPSGGGRAFDVNVSVATSYTARIKRPAASERNVATATGHAADRGG